jgi:hypothetical protein
MHKMQADSLVTLVFIAERLGLRTEDPDHTLPR